MMRQCSDDSATMLRRCCDNTGVVHVMVDAPHHEFVARSARDRACQSCIRVQGTNQYEYIRNIHKYINIEIYKYIDMYIDLVPKTSVALGGLAALVED